MSDNANAASPSNASAQQAVAGSSNSHETTNNVIRAIGNILKAQTGEPHSNEKISSLLLANMTTLVQQGKLTQSQIIQLKEFADNHKATLSTNQTTAASPSAASPKPGTPTISTSLPTAIKSSNSDAASTIPTLSSAADYYPSYNQTVTATNPGPVQWPQTRPTLTGGVVGGRLGGTPAQIARPPDDPAILTADDSRARRKNTPGDQSMRRTIQDLVASVDPNVKMEPEVEDLLLSVADEFIDSVTNFSCRLAKHRNADTLEVKDLQLHLERNHNIRVPGFASDDTKISLSQTAIVPPNPTTSGKKSTQGTHMTLRSQRLAQVQQAKREAKLM